MSPTPTAPRFPARTTRAVLVAGLDAALMVTALGIMYSLIVFDTLGPGAMPLALKAVAIALTVGGAVAMLVNRDLVVVAGPSATAALVVSATVEQLQHVPGLAGDRGTALFAVGLVAISAGVVPLVLAQARLGSALKFIPYPVLMGFINAVGLALVVSVVPFALGQDFRGRLVDVGNWFADWRPWALVVTAAGTAAGYATLRWLPLAPAAFVALGVATATHHGLASACASCAIGPRVAFGALSSGIGFADVFASPALGVAGWTIVLESAVTLGILNAVFSLMSTATVLRPQDAPIDGNRLLRKLGVASVASGLMLGLPVAIVTSATMTVRRMTARPVATLAVCTAGVAAIFWFGHRAFDAIPMAAVASSVFVIARTQFDAATWPLVRRALLPGAARRTALGALVVVLLVVAIGSLRSLASALFVGSLAAVCLLAIELRRDVVLAVHDGRAMRSRLVRGPLARARLDELGAQVRVIELAHWLYFGTADELARILDGQVDATWLLIDVRRVAGIDLTAARSLVYASERLATRGVRVVVAGLRRGDPRRNTIDALRGTDAHPLGLEADIDDALERAEDALLGDDLRRVDAATRPFPELDAADAECLVAHFEDCVVEAGRVLFSAGDAGDALYLLREGRMTMWVDRDDGSAMRLLSLGPGGVFGEMALLDGRPRSARAVADRDCRLAVLSRARFDALAGDDPALHAHLLRMLALRLIVRLRETTVLLDRALG